MMSGTLLGQGGRTPVPAVVVSVDLASLVPSREVDDTCVGEDAREENTSNCCHCCPPIDELG
jgi:hypothetical protein